MVMSDLYCLLLSILYCSAMSTTHSEELAGKLEIAFCNNFHFSTVKTGLSRPRLTVFESQSKAIVAC